MGLRGAYSSPVPARTGGQGGYLRGTRGRGVPRGIPYSVPPAIAARFRYVEAQIRRNRQEIIPFRGDAQFTATASSNNEQELDITNTFVGSAAHDESILGDRFYHRHLLLKWSSTSASVDQVRILVYRPRKAGNTITSLTNPYTQLVDQAAFVVYWDKVYYPNGGATLMGDQINIPLNFLTVTNRTIDAVESGEIRVLIYWNSTAAEENLHVGYRLLVQNK